MNNFEKLIEDAMNMTNINEGTSELFTVVGGHIATAKGKALAQSINAFERWAKANYDDFSINNKSVSGNVAKWTLMLPDDGFGDEAFGDLKAGAKADEFSKNGMTLKIKVSKDKKDNALIYYTFTVK